MRELIKLEPVKKEPVIVMESLGRIQVRGYNLEEGFQDTYDEHGTPVNRVSGVNLDDNHYMILEDDIDYNQAHPTTPNVCLPTRVWRLQQHFPRTGLTLGKQERASELVERVALAVYERQVARLESTSVIVSSYFEEPFASQEIID